VFETAFLYGKESDFLEGLPVVPKETFYEKDKRFFSSLSGLFSLTHRTLILILDVVGECVVTLVTHHVTGTPRGFSL
jgi:hypothetical protein